jgi:hypothetical protein
MLIQRTFILKTIILLLLFSAGTINSFAGASIEPILFGENLPFLADTLQPALTIPEKVQNEVINFQVNSEISYFNLSHFVKAESKQLFYKARMKEKEVLRLSQQTDSLRNSYANSADDQKEKITGQILSAEKQTLALNDEIPALYEKAREIENQYWQTASGDEKNKFQEKIRLFQDSIQKSITRQAQQIASSQTLPDTITFYRADQKVVASEVPVTAVVYKIQVAAFKTKLPETTAKAIKKLEMLRKVENYKDEKGITVYTTGSLKTYQEAVTLQSQVKLEGIKNATIAAYNNGKRITPEEARKLNNEPAVQPVKQK